MTKGITYVPIPPGSGENFAGLFTVELPPTVVTGQEFNIVVRRVASRRAGKQVSVTAIPDVRMQLRDSGTPGIELGAAPPRIAAQAAPPPNWRYVVGTFQVKIPVSNREGMLPAEESTLAIMKWRLQAMSPTSRWYPVLQRYIAYVSGRVAGLGGDPGAIPPSVDGVLPVPPSERGPSRFSCCSNPSLVFAIVAFLIFALVVLRLSHWGIGGWTWPMVFAAVFMFFGIAADCVALFRAFSPHDELAAFRDRTLRWFAIGAASEIVAVVIALIFGV